MTQREQVATCEQCGAIVEAGDKFCHVCGVTQPAPASAAPTSQEPSQKFFRCQQCGAEVAADPGQRSYVCPFCDSTFVVEFSPAESGRQAPEFVIGFAVTPQQAAEKFKAWMAAGGWFRPGDLQSSKIEEKLRGVYVPFWTFSLLAQSQWSAQIGEYWYRTETYTTMENGKMVTRTRTVTETEWWDLAGKHHKYYNGYLVSGSRGLSQQHADQIMPYRLPSLKRYEPYYLAGWLAEEYSVARDAALTAFQAKAHAQEQADVAEFLPGDTHANVQVETEFSHVNSDLILLPVYLLSYRYGEKLYRFVLNGQTGELTGEKPLSSWRIGVAIGAAILLIVALFLLMQVLS